MLSGCLSVTDTIGNQAAAYRSIAYMLDYATRTGVYLHTITLSAP